MNDIDLDILGGEFEQGVGQCLYRAVHIALDDDIQFLEVADSQASSDLFQADMLLGTDRLLTLQLLTLVGNLARLLFGGEDIEFVARLRRTVQTEYGTRFARQYLFYLLPTLVEHRFDASVVGTCQHDITDMERTVCHQQCCYIAAPLVERGLNNGTFSATLRVCF